MSESDSRSATRSTPMYPPPHPRLACGSSLRPRCSSDDRSPPYHCSPLRPVPRLHASKRLPKRRTPAQTLGAATPAAPAIEGPTATFSLGAHDGVLRKLLPDLASPLPLPLGLFFDVGNFYCHAFPRRMSLCLFHSLIWSALSLYSPVLFCLNLPW